MKLGFRIDGKLNERLVTLGDQVKINQLLARLDAQNEQNALRANEAEVNAAQASLQQADGYRDVNQIQRESSSLAARYSYLSLYIYVFFVLLSGSLFVLGGWLGGTRKSKAGGISVMVLAAAIYLFDNWVVLFVWLRVS